MQLAPPSRALVASRLLLGLASLLVGAWALEQIRPGLGWVYAGAFLLHAWGFYPRFICLHCPLYGRICPSGGGKIAALLFDRAADRDDPTVFAKRKRLGHLAGIALRSAPITLLAILLAGPSRTDQLLWAAFAALLVLGFAEGKLYSTRNCRTCRAQAHCPARWSASSPAHTPTETDPT